MPDLIVNPPFVYTQSTPAAIWSINHNLGVYPIVAVMVYDSTNTLVPIIPGAIIVIDLNNIVIEFSSPTGYAGFARLI